MKLGEKSRIIFFMKQSAVGFLNQTLTVKTTLQTFAPERRLPKPDCLMTRECEGIENRHIKMCEIPGVARNQRQSMHLSRGGDQRIFIGVI